MDDIGTFDRRDKKNRVGIRYGGISVYYCWLEVVLHSDRLLVSNIIIFVIHATHNVC